MAEPGPPFAVRAPGVTISGVEPVASDRDLEVAADNQEATEAWTGVLFERFVQYRDLIVQGLAHHGETAMAAYPPKPGDRVLDIGCGFGDATLALGALVGSTARPSGWMCRSPSSRLPSPRRTRPAPRTSSFLAGDVQVMELPGPFDYAFSRMGIMFFANPVAALRNIRGAMAPGGHLVGVVWRRKDDNPWVHRAEEVVDRYLEEPEESDEPTCGPGPFSMANADTVSEQLKIAGFEEISLQRCDLPIKIGNDLDHAVEFNMALGPAAEVIRLVGAEAERIRPKLEVEIREVLTEFDQGPNGVIAPASTWIVTATAPAGA